MPPGAHHTAGFEIAKQGEHAVRESLARIARACDAEPRKAYGSLFMRLNFEYVEEFAPYRRLLREVILDNWLISAGTNLLGEVLEERRRHSLTTASQEIGIGPELLEHFLIEAGALPSDDDRPPRRRLFDARKYAYLLNEIQTLVGRPTMQKAIGATKMELEAFEKEGLLVPRTRVPKVKKPWRISDGVDFLAGLFERAVPIAENDSVGKHSWSPASGPG